MPLSGQTLNITDIVRATSQLARLYLFQQTLNVIRSNSILKDLQGLLRFVKSPKSAGPLSHLLTTKSTVNPLPTLSGIDSVPLVIVLFNLSDSFRGFDEPDLNLANQTLNDILFRLLRKYCTYRQIIQGFYIHISHPTRNLIKQITRHSISLYSLKWVH